MITILSKFIIKEGMTEDGKRTAYGTLCGTVGIVLNILMFAGKLFAGLISNSVSIVADAMNNLSDAGSSIITIAGFRLSSRKADSKHPYGHGRIEYITGFIISTIIIVMGFELMKESIGKIVNSEPVEISALVTVILVAAIIVKGYMAFYNFSVGRKIDSATLRATAKDSLSDCLSTAVVLITTIISRLTGVYLDGWAGAVVSLFIFYTGFSAARESIGPLLGNPPSPEYIAHIRDIVMSFDPNIVGIHDLIVHDYGPGRKMITLHTEVPSDGDVLVLHDIIDNLEKKLSTELGCMATIHMDPVNIRDPRVAELKEQVRNLAVEIYDGITIHDFRVVFGDTHSNLLFDLAVPFECTKSNDVIIDEMQALVRDRLGKNYYCVLEIDRGDGLHYV